MYTSFRVKNYRIFDELVLDDLSRINLIAGRNNVGKTALLEALYLHGRPYSPEASIHMNTSRGMKTEARHPGGTIWDWIFSHFDASQTIELKGVDQKTGQRSLELKIIRDAELLANLNLNISKEQFSNGVPLSSEPIQVLAFDYQQEGNKQQGIQYITTVGATNMVYVVPSAFTSPFPVSYILSQGRPSADENATRFSNLEISGEQYLLLESLRIIEPRLNRLVLLHTGGESILWGEVGLEKLPLSLMGDGVSRLANLILSIADNRDGVVLVDEIENGLHYSVLSDVWKAISEAARTFNTQIFATTHSWECVVAAHRAFAESGNYDFRYHRLDRSQKTGKISVVTYEQETLESSIESGVEIR